MHQVQSIEDNIFMFSDEEYNNIKHKCEKLKVLSIILLSNKFESINAC